MRKRSSRSTYKTQEKQRREGAINSVGDCNTKECCGGGAVSWHWRGLWGFVRPGGLQEGSVGILGRGANTCRGVGMGNIPVWRGIGVGVYNGLLGRAPHRREVVKGA